MDRLTLDNGVIRAVIKVDGGELCSLRRIDGPELIWQAGPQWPRHAPVLFPIVGRLKGDVFHYRGQSYPLTQHGFARDQRFTVIESSAAACALLLQDSAATRTQYPFGFNLRMGYALHAAELHVIYDVSNTGDEEMPMALGAHPAFNWPLPGNDDMAAYRVTFPNDEPADIRRLSQGLMLPAPQPTPVQGRELPLSKALFAADAVIMDQIASTSLRFGAPGTPTIALSWTGFEQLGIWSRADDARFICLEPWAGYASPVDFDGELCDKPGMLSVEPGETMRFSMTIGID